MSNIKHNPAFTPLEKVHPVRKKISNGIKGRNSLTGFTLVEVLVALAILAAGILAVFNLFPLGWQSFAYAKKINAVSLFAEKKLEELKLSGQLQDSSGQYQDLIWNAQIKPLTLPEAISLTQVQLDISFEFREKKFQERFVTYAEQ